MNKYSYRGQIANRHLCTRKIFSCRAVKEHHSKQECDQTNQGKSVEVGDEKISEVLNQNSRFEKSDFQDIFLEKPELSQKNEKQLTDKQNKQNQRDNFSTQYLESQEIDLRFPAYLVAYALILPYVIFHLFGLNIHDGGFILYIGTLFGMYFRPIVYCPMYVYEILGSLIFPEGSAMLPPQQRSDPMDVCLSLVLWLGVPYFGLIALCHFPEQQVALVTYGQIVGMIVAECAWFVEDIFFPEQQDEDDQ